MEGRIAWCRCRPGGWHRWQPGVSCSKYEHIHGPLLWIAPGKRPEDHDQEEQR